MKVNRLDLKLKNNNYDMHIKNIYKKNITTSLILKQYNIK